MDGSLSRMRGKADFRLMRELLGLPQEWVAKRVGVDARTVRNWESPRYFYPPKREAWDLVEGLWRRADGKAAGLVEIASSAARVARERGVEPAPLMLAYWRDAAQWAKAIRRTGMRACGGSRTRRRGWPRTGCTPWACRSRSRTRSPRRDGCPLSHVTIGGI